MLWAIVRACVQSITIDEADTYLAWAATAYPEHWQAASNNHVLNSILMRLTTSVFGVSHLSVRAPALLGAAIYILAAWALCRLLVPEVVAQWALFVGMVYNPFVFDHLVAARGYALAMAFLTAALAVAAYSHERSWPQVKACAVCSMCLSLSFAANFSFAIVDAVTMTGIAIWAFVRTQAARERLRIIGASIIPAALVALFVSFPVVLKFRRGALSYGSHSLSEWFGEVLRDSLWQLSPHILNPMLRRILVWVAPVLVPALLLLAIPQWIRARKNPVLWLLLGVIAAAIFTHWAAFHFFHLLMPKQRTAIWIVPLVMLAIGAVVSGKRALTAALCALSIYFLLCTRLNYFREWSWNADVQKVYPVLAWYNHTYGERNVTSHWMYAAALNFYRVASGRENFEEIDSFVERCPPGRRIYVLCNLYHKEFIKQEGLRVIYRGPSTDILVAIRPEVEARSPVRLQ